ncbi:DUF6702 family protein [Tenacibaculum maritimum]|uniref:Peptidase E n=11 Tax=Tenacibaculum maritimum TaxID=107401 RepID=A0A2H1E974_9FLAO|nr:DUF6702 family protein [Tenacibaculum maritimum]CAA0195525.1 conserved hypothetical protein [Tenacibaculum maritimum]SFZ81947.1 conserved protein of unknown function [Tenacibaculum maritimum NCIMB 2154]
MKLKKVLLLLTTISLLSFSIHKYYLSLTQIAFNEKHQSVQIIMNLFIDDIETAINQTYHIDAQLTTNKELQNIDTYFIKYLETNFKIKINGSSKTYNFIGKEYDGNIVYFYLEVENIPLVKAIEVENKILMNYFLEQQNLIKTKIGKQHKSLLFTKKNHKGLLKF